MQQSSVTSSDSFMISTNESSVISSAIASKSKPGERDATSAHELSMRRCQQPRTVDVLPEADAVVHEFSAIHTGEHDLCLRGRHDAGRLEEAVSSDKNRVEHRLVEAATNEARYQQ